MLIFISFIQKFEILFEFERIMQMATWSGHAVSWSSFKYVHAGLADV